MNRRLSSWLPIVCFFFLPSGLAWAQITVAPPSISPAAINGGTHTTATVSALVTSTGSTIVQNGVSVLQVDQTGGNARVMGVLNDNGINGDLIPGDGLFGGTVILNQTNPA